MCVYIYIILCISIYIHIFFLSRYVSLYYCIHLDLSSCTLYVVIPFFGLLPLPVSPSPHRGSGIFRQRTKLNLVSDIHWRQAIQVRPHRKSQSVCCMETISSLDSYALKRHETIQEGKEWPILSLRAGWLNSFDGVLSHHLVHMTEATTRCGPKCQLSCTPRTNLHWQCSPSCTVSMLVPCKSCWLGQPCSEWRQHLRPVFKSVCRVCLECCQQDSHKQRHSNKRSTHAKSAQGLSVFYSAGEKYDGLSTFSPWARLPGLKA